MKYRSVPALATVVMFSLILGGCGKADRPMPFQIAASGYLIGTVEPCNCPGNPLGGLSRRATVTQQLITSPSSTLMIDVGSFLSLSRDESKAITELTLAGMKQLGVQAVNITLRDLRLGLPFLLEMNEYYQIPFVSANVLDAVSGKPAFETHRIVRLRTDDGVMDVAVIGLANGVEGRYLPPEYGVSIAHPAEALSGVLDQVRGRVAAVVLLTDGDRGAVAEWLNRIQAEQEISAIFSCTLSPNRSTYATISHIPFTTTGRQGKFLDLIDMTPQPDGSWTMKKQGTPLNGSVENDPVMDEFLASARVRLGLADADPNFATDFGMQSEENEGLAE